MLKYSNLMVWYVCLVIRIPRNVQFQTYLSENIFQQKINIITWVHGIMYVSFKVADSLADLSTSWFILNDNLIIASMTMSVLTAVRGIFHFLKIRKLTQKIYLFTQLHRIKVTDHTMLNSNKATTAPRPSFPDKFSKILSQTYDGHWYSHRHLINLYKLLNRRRHSQ